MLKCRAMVRRPSDDSIAPPIAGDHQTTLSRGGVVDYLLVVTTVAIMLGLGALMVSLAPAASDRSDVLRPWTPVGIERSDALLSGPSGDEPVRSPADGVTPAALQPASTGSRWRSALQPPMDAVTTEAGLAHVGTTASPQNPRTFLMGAAIQVHAPASAPAPRRRSTPPHPHGVD
jgi:hypothetical protein